MNDHTTLETLRQEIQFLREREALFRYFLDQSPLVAFLKDAAGRYVYANKPTLQIFHRSAEELRGKTDFDLMPADLAQQLREHDREVLTSQRALHVAEMVPGLSGTMHTWLVLKFPCQGEGGPLVGGVALNVTEQRRAEDQLRQTLGLLRAITETLPDAVYVKDRSGRYLLINSPGARLIGKTIAEVVGQDDTALFDPEAARRIQELDRQVLATGLPQTYEDVATAGNLTRTWLTTKYPYRDRQGNVVGVIGISRDVTDLRRVEAEKRVTEKRFQALIEKSYDGLTLLESTGQVRYASPSIFHLLGYLPTEFQGRNVFELIHEEDRPRCQTLFGSMLGRPGRTASAECRYRHKDGSWRWTEGTGTNLLDDPAVEAVVVNYRDVTERHQAEEALREREGQLRLLVEQIPGIIWTMDRELRFTSSLGAGLTALGLKPNEIVGQPLTEYLGTDAPSHPIVAAHRQALAGESASIQVEWQERTYEFHVEPFRGKKQDITGVIGIAFDVTERKQAEEALRKTEEQLRQAQKMEAVGRLAAGVAHDFNNLLTIINGYSEVLLQRLPASDLGRDMVEEIRKAGERAAALTGQLLAFSRKQAFQLEILDLRTFLADLERLLARLLGEDVELVTALDPAPILIRADRGQLTQVVMNLAVNARDAMPAGGTLLIRARNVELDESFCRNHPGVQPGPYAELTLRDTGRGMDQTVKAHLFEPFFTTKEPGKGTGLGLATVYGIVKQTGGHVEMESELGRGTTCTVYWPGAERAAPTLEQETIPETRGRETVLLAEDEVGVRDLTRLVLRSNGYTVLEAADGPAALALAERHPGPIHLLVTDVVMPLMSGPQLAQRLRVPRPGVKVLYLSGYPDEALTRHGLSRHDGFLQKPFTPSALARKVRDVLDLAPASP
jgi:PAS domain S-box-containing protein